MFRGYAIKLNCYQGKDGKKVDTLEQVATFENEAEAERMAKEVGGSVIRVGEYKKRPKSRCKPNQIWLRKIKYWG